MRILISLSYYLPNISGVTVYARNLAIGLSKHAHQVTILTSQHKKELPVNQKTDGFEIIRLPVNLQIGRGVIMFSFPFRAWKLVKNHDIINCHLPQFEAFILVIIAKLQRKKVVSIYHVDLPIWPGILNYISFLLIYISNLICLTLSDQISTYTEEYAVNSHLLKYFTKKTSYIFPPVILDNSNTFDIIKVTNKYKIGFVGRISRQKGIPILIDSIEHLKKLIGNDFKIYLVGPKEVIGENYLDEIDEMIKKNGEFIELVGKVEPQHINSIYKDIDLLVLPSTLESFGIVQMEAMLNKVPVVTTNLPGVRKAIEFTGMGEIVKINDPKDLAEKMAKVLIEKQKYIKNYSKAKNLFDFETSIDQTIEIFNR